VAQTVEPRRTQTRPRWWTELALVASAYLLYVLSRIVVPAHTTDAIARGGRLLHLERAWHLAPELAINTAVSSHRLVAVLMDYHYATLHYIVTPAVLVWLLITRPDRYRHARRVLVVATIIGVVGFWLAPVAPPRLLGIDGITDTMARFAGYGWWSQHASAPRGLGGLTNEYAAMPSLHVGWALWCGYQLVRYGTHSWQRVAGVVYPVSTVIVVMATGNHFFLDAVAGAFVIIVAALIVTPGERILGSWWRARHERLAVAT
jgi:PAP2 superfamily protein